MKSSACALPRLSASRGGWRRLADAPASPRAKRAVPTARAVAAAAKRERAKPPPEDPTPATRPGFRRPPPAPIVENDDTDDPGTNYALRLTEALEAISSAQTPRTD